MVCRVSFQRPSDILLFCRIARVKGAALPLGIVADERQEEVIGARPVTLSLPRLHAMSMLVVLTVWHR
jgi:hypothetical protein